MQLRTALIAVGLAVLAVAALAQAPSAGSSFDAVSIKANKSGDNAIGGGGGAGTEYRVTNIPLRVLISQAYAMRHLEVTGGPAWLDTDRFDIVGKMPPPGSPFAMVRTLLADRFKLVTHNETRQLPIYAVVVAKSNGRLGPKLQPSSCAAGRKPDGTRCGMRPGPGLFVGAATIQMLADASLSSEVQRKVVNRTGLTGVFDIDLHWSPDGPAGVSTSSDPAVSIFTALQEQLGLKLESTTGPVDVLVIDHIERPSED
jgi:uncharacterized protein (TIGR03435 family)